MTRGAKKPTLADVAALAGVSIYTVSRTLSASEGVSETSRAKVDLAVRELGYVRNRAAQELRRNSRSSITVITASTSNAYYLDMMTGVQDVLRSSGRSAIVTDIAADGVYTPKAESVAVHEVIQSRSAGVISTLPLSTENLALLTSWDVPVVFADSAPPEGSDAGFVGTDNIAAGHLLGDHLASHGHRSWLFLAYPDRWSTRVPREEGLAAAARAHGAQLTVVECENSPRAAAAATDALVANGTLAETDVVIAGNNPLLLGAMSSIRNHNISVPTDVSLVAFDEFQWAPLLDPPVTVLNEDSAHIGRLATETLMRLIDEQVATGESAKPLYRPADRQLLTSQLIIRSSCGCTP